MKVKVIKCNDEFGFPDMVVGGIYEGYEETNYEGTKYFKVEADDVDEPNELYEGEYEVVAE